VLILIMVIKKPSDPAAMAFSADKPKPKPTTADFKVQLTASLL
jgi:hypothetical protein